jgi:hypothetical protein
MMKKILALTLALLTVAAISSCKKEDEADLNSLDEFLKQDITYSSYEDPNTHGIFYFESIDSDSVKITDYSGPVAMHNVTIPAVVKTGEDTTKNVTTIAKKAFHAVSSIESLTIPEGITTIEEYAFAQCVQMTSVSLPSTLETIEKGAFLQCGITSLNLSTSQKLSKIGAYAFSKCNNLEEITIPGNVKTVGMAAFFECTGVKKVVLEEGVTLVEELAFQGCTALAELELPSTFANTTSPIEDLAFLGSDVLYYENIKAPENTKAYEYKEAMKAYLQDAPVVND